MNYFTLPWIPVFFNNELEKKIFFGLVAFKDKQNHTVEEKTWICASKVEEPFDCFIETNMKRHNGKKHFFKKK